MISTILYVKGIEVEVTYRMEGRYYPATSTDPAEYPTVNVINWFALTNDADALEYTLSEQFLKDLDEAILEEEAQNC
jgi:hypothetical protein